MSKRKLILCMTVCTIFFSTFASQAEAGFFRDFFKLFRAPRLPNIVEFVIDQNEKTGEFSTLLSAVLTVTADPNQPDLVTALSESTLTVFAPTDEAFGNLGLDPNSVAELPTDALADILLYHVTEGRRRALPLLFQRDVEMLNGDLTEVTLNFRPFGVFVNDSKVINANLRASNGIVHVIDEVLLPPMDPDPGPPPTISVNIPEPSSLAICLGLVGVLGVRRSARKS